MVRNLRIRFREDVAREAVQEIMAQDPDPKV
jgi:hypothetical protein